MAAAIQVQKWAVEAGLGAGIAGTAFAVLVSGAEQVGVDTIAQQVLQVGAPAMLGQCVSLLVGPATTTKKTPTDYLLRGAIAGLSGSAVLVAAGVMPLILDTQMVTFVGLLGASAIVGEMAANAITL